MFIKTQQMLVTVLMVSVTQLGVAQESLTANEQIVIDHYKSMIDMNSEERKIHREQLFSKMTRAEQKNYQLAFKSIRPRLLELLDVDQDPLKKSPKVSTANSGQVPKVAGTSIQYDAGVAVGGAGLNSQMLGNRFDSALNTMGTACCFPVETSGSVTMATFEMLNTQFSSAVFSIYSNIMGTTAAQVTSRAIAGLMTGLNTVTIGGAGTSNNYANGSFLAGIWQFNPTQTGLAIDTNTVGGQGYHGISLNDGALASMITTVTNGGMGVNAILRLQGNLATGTVPVELIDFTIEENN